MDTTTDSTAGDAINNTNNTAVASSPLALSSSEPQSAPQGGILCLQHILVPVDFSAPARKAVAYAVAFARQFHARLTLLHVMEMSFAGTGMAEIEVPLLENEIRQNALQEMETLCKEALDPSVPSSTQIRIGRPWHEICLAAKELNVDLLIVGTHGYTGLTHVVMGSTAERVVRHAPCPVLVVREKEHEFVQPA